MDERIMVEVYVPAAQQAFDFIVPLDAQIQDVKVTLVQMLTEVTKNEFVGHSTTTIYIEDTKEILQGLQTMRFSGVKHGTRLIIL